MCASASAEGPVASVEPSSAINHRAGRTICANHALRQPGKVVPPRS